MKTNFRKTNIALLVLVSIFVIALCAYGMDHSAAPSEIAWGAEVEGLQLGLSISQVYSYERTKRIFVDFVLVNNRKEAVSIACQNTMFAYRITMKDAQGEDVSLTEKGQQSVKKWGAASDRSGTRYGMLQPGENLTDRFDVGYYFALNPGENYTISAVRIAPCKLGEANIAAGVSSGSVTFTYKPAKKR